VPFGSIVGNYRISGNLDSGRKWTLPGCDGISYQMCAHIDRMYKSIKVFSCLYGRCDDNPELVRAF
jgi:hypothetical protein